MKIVLLLAFALVHVCTGREIVKKNVVIFEFGDSDERDLAYYDASSFDDEADDIFEDEDLGALTYPDDCKRPKLFEAANRGGCYTTEEEDMDTSVSKKKNTRFITTIPYSPHEGKTCRSFIDAINANCSDELKYPVDCTNKKKIINAASRNGCFVKKQNNHLKVYKTVPVTSIPQIVKQDSTCKAVINALNANC